MRCFFGCVLLGLFSCEESLDSNSDKMVDDTGVETEQSTDVDSDGDGLLDSEEVAFGSDPQNPDSDGDGLQDAEEKEKGTNPMNSDSDGDGLGDFEESQGTTDPLVSDTDGDGFDDGFETTYNTDPNNPLDFPRFPNDGSWSHQNPQFTNDGCNLESVLQDQGGDIFNFFPQNFEVSESTPENFSLTIEQAALCTIQDSAFTCDRLYDSKPIETPNVSLDIEFGMSGTVMSGNSMNFAVEVYLANCDGGPIACGLLGLVGITIPCSTFISTSASP
jgi:hypothetical protein